MAVVYNVTVRNNRLQQVINAIDAGVGNGLLKLTTSGSLVLATIVLNKPCATISSGIMTFSGTPLTDAAADATGTAALGIITDSAATTVVSGLTVGLAGTDIIIDSVSIAINDVVTFLSGVVTGN